MACGHGDQISEILARVKSAAYLRLNIQEFDFRAYQNSTPVVVPTAKAELKLVVTR